MNKDLQRGVQKKQQEKAAHDRTIEEMRNEGATAAEGDLARNVEEEKKRLKARQAVREAFKDK